MKKTIILALTILLCTGCGSSDSIDSQKTSDKTTEYSKGDTNENFQDEISTENNSKTESSEQTSKQPPEVTTNAWDVYPDTAKMAADIDASGANFIRFDMEESYTMTTMDVSIDKASKEDKTFIVYCTANQENEYFKGKNKYRLTYKFYEIGGWILEEYDLEDINMTPIELCYKELAAEALETTFNFSEYELVKTEKIEDDDCVYYYRGIYNYNYAVKTLECTVRCMYDNANGWSCFANYNDYEFDFSKMYGEWYGEYLYYGTDSTKNCTLKVKEIDFKNKKAVVYIDIRSGMYDPLPTEIVGTICNSKESEIKNYNEALYYVKVSVPYPEGLTLSGTTVWIYFDENYGVKKVENNSDHIMMTKIN